MLSKHATIPERMGIRFGCTVRSAEYSHRTRKRGLSLSFSPKKSFLSLCPSLLLSLEIGTHCLCLLSSRLLRQLLDWAINRQSVGRLARLGPHSHFASIPQPRPSTWLYSSCKTFHEHRMSRGGKRKAEKKSCWCIARLNTTLSVCRMSHRKLRETKQQLICWTSLTLLGYHLVSLHVQCDTCLPYT